MENTIVISDSNNPYHNLALEKLLFLSDVPGNILYLWQNSDTVVIGRNQNPWKECNLELIEKDGIFLARRESGGGAVFHDLGNLNFTFISSLGKHDVSKQMRVIQHAVKSLGVYVELKGRNDLIISENGCKFSGNAFQQNRNNALHHGTILIDVDTTKLGRYLTPSKRKLEAKGIKSVVSRVCNLKSVQQTITVDKIKTALVQSFESAFGEAAADKQELLDKKLLSEYEQELSSWEWRIGQAPKYNMYLTQRFPWGEVEFMFQVNKGYVVDAKIFSDALNENMILNIAPVLTGCLFKSEAISKRLTELGFSESKDLANWINHENF